MKKEIIIIDDDPIYSLVVSKMIHKLEPNTPIHFSTNGLDAIQKLENMSYFSNHILLLLDINMEQQDGWFFLDSMQKKGYQLIPNIHTYIITSSTDTSDIEKVKNYSWIKKYIHKPVYLKDVVELMTIPTSI
jgi:CheY-like chemotaxis protein